ncbi:MAG: anthranilate phosphoribosyltransferase [Polyangiaceae bacterium]
MSERNFPAFFAEVTRPNGDIAGAVRRAFDAILAGEWTPVQVAGLAVALRMLGDRPDVVAAAASSLRASMVAVEHDLATVMDTCGTGGDGLGTWNISTAAAFIVAGAGVPVAKHGNRAVSSRCGSADVLEALGVALDVPPEAQSSVLRDAGIAFLFAPSHHPALRHGGVARRELGIRTLFNALGPLASPARVTHQLLGAYDDNIRPVLARTLAQLGARAAWVVRGADGLDEVSPCGPTSVSELRDGEVIERVVHPGEFGFEPMAKETLLGGSRDENAEMILTVLELKPHPARDAVVLNAAAALCVARGLAPRDARELAESSLASGQAREALSRLVALSRARSATQG